MKDCQRKSNKRDVVKRKIKFLSVEHNFEVARAVLKQALNAVIRTLSIEALKTLQGALAVSPHLKNLFSHLTILFIILIVDTC